jgi:hypothetical protein
MDFYIKRNDTLPILEYQCIDILTKRPVDIHDSTIRFCMGYKFTLPSAILTVGTTQFAWPDQVPYLLVNDVMTVDQERMKITSIDRITNIVVVDRAVDNTEAAKHPTDSMVQILRVESAGVLKNDGTDGWVRYEWSSTLRDTKMSGKYDAEFEVTFLQTGKRQTYPMANQAKLRINIIDDVNCR